MRSKIANLRLKYSDELRREVKRRYRNGEKRLRLMEEYGLNYDNWLTVIDGNPGVPSVRCDFESMYRKMGRPRATK